MTRIETIKALQRVLGVKADGVWGPRSKAALEAVVNAEWHVTKASSFADPADVAAFRRCKAQGNSDKQCFRVGDNGIGFWEDDTTADIPYCALPPEDLIERWGIVNAAHMRMVEVQLNGRTITCMVADTMPHRANITNGAGIDLNPTACRMANLEPPTMVKAQWRWVEA